ncbi:uncharacterized protein JCM10292_006928 [Rhodotorula paludigena]|uniref:uncharacterized protein n=1 Tax=Rhodotorula paludigena TaxID=86838 RepID=UPI00317C152E
MATAVPTGSFQRIVRREGVLDLAFPARIERRQAVPSATGDAPGGGDDTTTAAEPTTTTTTTTISEELTSTTTTTTSSPDPTTTTTSDETTTTTTSRTTTSRETTTTEPPSSSAPADTTVTNVITPTTVVVVAGTTSTITLEPTTSTGTRSLSPSEAAQNSGGSGGLSTGAKVGIGVGAGVGGVALLAVLLFLCFGFARRRREKRDASDNILWPATGDSTALYPEPVHNTGRAGFGVGDDGDDLDEMPGRGGPSMAEVGAGAAGVGAAAGALGRYGSQSTGGHQPSLPAIPPSVYTSDHSGGYGSPYGGETSENNSAYATTTPSQHSHAPLALGPASVGYVASHERTSPSPPRTGSASNDGHVSYEGAHGSQSGHLPYPGDPDFEAPDRMTSPRPMQVGDTFGAGYDETDGGRRWRLSVVNDDPRDRD